MTVTVRAATLEDLPAIKAVGEATWPTTYAFAGAEYIEHGLATWWSESALARSLRETVVRVGCLDEQIVGVGTLDLRGEFPVIWKMYVLPTAQGSGVGSAVLEALLAEAPPGRGPIRLEYIEGNEPAAAFYRARGFVELRRDPGEQPGWPAQVWMQRDIG